MFIMHAMMARLYIQNLYMYIYSCPLMFGDSQSIIHGGSVKSIQRTHLKKLLLKPHVTIVPAVCCETEIKIYKFHLF